MKKGLLLFVSTLIASSVFADLPKPILLKKDGGWCWYQDERVVVIDNQIIFATVKSPSGDIDVSSWNIDNNQTTNYTLAENFNSDDHAAAAFLVLDDKRILTTWSSHGYNAVNKKDNKVLYYTTTKNPADITEWESVKSLKNHGCYNNLMKTSNGTIYDFYRGSGWGPSYWISKDNGDSFSFGGNSFQFAASHKTDPKRTKLDGNRPYVKYVSDFKDTMHFTTTNSHPRSYDNSIYHGYIKNSEMFNSDGKKISNLMTGDEKSPQIPMFTEVYEGDAENVAWTIDINLDENGYPVILFSVQKDCGYLRQLRDHQSFDLRYFYARYDGAKWIVNEMAYAGTSLYSMECDYTGLCTINPQDVNTVYISTDANPETGLPLVSLADGRRHYEIFKGVTSDMGKSWKWTSITKNSTYDNLRPIVPITNKDFKGEGTPLLWCIGTLTDFCNYQLDVVGIFDK